MYYSHKTLMDDFEKDKISAQEVFYNLNRISLRERKKFITKAKGILLVKNNLLPRHNLH